MLELSSSPYGDYGPIYIDQPLYIWPRRYPRTGDLQYDEAAFSDTSLTTVEEVWPNCFDVNESGTSGSAANDEDFAEGGISIEENNAWSKNHNHEDSVDGPLKKRSPKVSRRDTKGKRRDTCSMQTSVNASSMVLRGLPFQLSMAELTQFLEDAGINKNELAGDPPCTLLQNNQGKPSGFAEIQLANGVNFWDIRQKIHMQRFGHRYVEVMPPRETKGAGQPVAPPSSRQGGGRKQRR